MGTRVLKTVLTASSRPLAERLLYASAFFVVLLVLHLCGRYSYLLFHSLVEIMSVVIASTLFILAWNTRPYLKSGYLEFIGIGYGAIAIIDLMHTLAYKGLNITSSSGYSSSRSGRRGGRTPISLLGCAP